MKKRNALLIFGILLFTLPVLAIIKSGSPEFGKNLSAETCSSVVENLKLCIADSKITVDSGEPLVIHLSWINLSNAERYIGVRSSGYSITINDEKGKKLIPVFEQRQMDREKRIQNSTATTEDLSGITVVRSGSDRGIYLEANETESDTALLDKLPYDYDLTAKGKYNVSISKTVASLEDGKKIEFVINDIEIQVK